MGPYPVAIDILYNHYQSLYKYDLPTNLDLDKSYHRSLYNFSPENNKIVDANLELQDPPSWLMSIFSSAKSLYARISTDSAPATPVPEQSLLQLCIQHGDNEALVSKIQYVMLAVLFEVDGSQGLFAIYNGLTQLNQLSSTQQEAKQFATKFIELFTPKNILEIQDSSQLKTLQGIGRIVRDYLRLLHEQSFCIKKLKTEFSKQPNQNVMAIFDKFQSDIVSVLNPLNEAKTLFAAIMSIDQGALDALLNQGQGWNAAYAKPTWDAITESYKNAWKAHKHPFTAAASAAIFPTYQPQTYADSL